MKYRIKINNPGNSFANPLLLLDEDEEFSTYDDACNEIFSRLYDVIDGENGLDCVPKILLDQRLRELCDGLMIDARTQTIRQNDADDKAVPLAEHIIQNAVFSEDFEKSYADANWGDFPGLRDKIINAFRDDETYTEKCKEFIFKEGMADHDGVSVHVEKIGA